MKIGIITEIISFKSGARAPLELAKHLAKRGHEISVYGYDFEGHEKANLDLKAHNVLVFLFKKPYPSFIGRYFASVSLFKQLRRDNPQVLMFAGTLLFFLAGKLTGIPIIQMYMGTQFDAFLESTIPKQPISLFRQVFNSLINFYIYLSCFTLYRFSTSVVAISRYAGNEGKCLYKRKPDKVIYLGATNLLKKHGMAIEKNNTIKLLSVSRITPYKGFHLILEAIKKVKTKKNILVTIAGSQPKMRYVAYLKKIGGKNIDIIIDPTDQQLARLYQNSDIYVTADRYLYFGLPIFEAAQFEKPTLSLNFAAANELILHGKTGFVANNVDNFAYYLQKLIEDEKLRNKLGYNALQWSKKFSWEKCAKEWEKVLLKYE